MEIKEAVEELQLEMIVRRELIKIAVRSDEVLPTIEGAYEMAIEVPSVLEYPLQCQQALDVVRSQYPPVTIRVERKE